MTVPVAIIAAVAKNWVIGSGNELPWRLPSDFAFFKRTTMGKPLIMGRRTFESIGKPLPGRTNIVVTRQLDYRPEGVLTFDDLTAALAQARSIAHAASAPEVMIGGGAEIYRQIMPAADRLYITHVDAAPGGDAVFPEIGNTWHVVGEPDVAPGPHDSAPFRIKIYERRPGAR